MKVQSDTDGDSLEPYRAKVTSAWVHVADVEWRQGVYHNGEVSNLMARAGPTTWVMDSVQRNTCLDDVTEEDVEEGRLSDDQLQALCNTTVEEAQAAEYRRIVAVCEGGDEASAKAAMLKALRVQMGGGVEAVL